MWTKICGIRTVEAAREVAALRPAALGLVFYERSPRCVASDTAREIVELLRAGESAVEPIGLFVNESAETIAATVRRCGLGVVQLHGDESPAALAELQGEMPELRIVRALRLGADGMAGWSDYFAECAALGVRMAGCLVDAHVSGAYGGTGVTVSWERVRAEYRYDGWPPLILAGGLTPENVGEAIEGVRPWGVDVSSGVESAPGVKDIAKVRRFLESARAAFEKLQSSPSERS